MTATELAAGFGLLGVQGLTGRIEESFLRRLDDLSADARLLLLIAAAEPVGDWADLAENGEGTVAQAFVFTFA